MSKRMTAPRNPSRSKGLILGRERFRMISEVEGIRLDGEMKRAFAEFDRAGLSAAQRRRSIIARFIGGAR